jgi:hypothetical protein
VKEVRATKHCLCSFEEKNSVNYMRTVRRLKDGVRGRLLAEQLRALSVIRKIVAVHVFIVR